MDRITVYSGEVPRTVDFLQAEQNTMVSIGKLAHAGIGTGFVNGFSCSPNTPAALNVILGGGEVYQMEPLEATTWSALNADTVDNIVKQGLFIGSQTIPLTPPGTTGFSQVFLIEVQYQDLDTGSTVLPYYNAANPAAPFSGPGNSGTAQNTTRKGFAAVQVKAGTAATTGTQVAPTVDAGWIGLWLVTLAQGQTTITSGNIVMVANAPVIGSSYLPRLSTIPAYIQSGAWGYVPDTGSANALAVAPTPPPVSVTTGMKLTVKVAAAVTGATTVAVKLASGSTSTASVVHGDGTALLANDLVVGQVVELNFDGSNWQMPRASASVAANQLTASSVGTNMPINCQIQAATPGAGVLTITIVGANGAALSVSNPMVATFRDSTAANGDPVTRIVTSNPTFTVNSGNTLGTLSGVAQKLWVVLIDNAGTVLVGLVNANGQAQIFPLIEDQLASTGSGTGGGNSAGVIYTSVASLSGKAIRIIGCIEWTTALATAGTWNNPPNRATLFTPGMKKPGDVVQGLYAGSSSSSITPTSAANLVRVMARVSVSVTNVSSTVSYKRGATTIFSDTIGIVSEPSSATMIFTSSAVQYDNPASASSQTYSIAVSAGTAADNQILIEEICA